MVSEEARQRVERIVKHAQQVADGLIPVDSPPDFVRPENGDALVRGFPWFMASPEYKPTPQALIEVSKRR